MSSDQHLEPGMIRIGNQLIRSDRALTIAAYSGIEAPWSDKCNCAPCRNFRPQRDAAFPQSFLGLLEQLGIDPAKESEIYGCYPLPLGARQYGGWFFLCGLLLENTQGEITKDGVTYYVRGPGDMPAPDKSFEPHPLALEFTIELPWVLAGEDPDELYGPAANVMTERSHA